MKRQRQSLGLLLDLFLNFPSPRDIPFPSRPWLWRVEVVKPTLLSNVMENRILLFLFAVAQSIQAFCAPAGSASPRLYVGPTGLPASTESTYGARGTLLKKSSLLYRLQFKSSVRPCFINSSHKNEKAGQGCQLWMLRTDLRS